MDLHVFIFFTQPDQCIPYLWRERDASLEKWKDMERKEIKMDGYSVPMGNDLTCLECGRTVTNYGRSDKKFCCPECKNRYHNRNAGLHRNIRSRALRALDRNWSILDALLKKGKTCIQLAELLDAGFNIGYVTSVVKSRGQVEYYCFDIRYRRSVGRVFGIRREV